ncbi:NAD(P)-dependent oxidoreductase [Phytohalomonas tamaricis]|uniref:NAD(P)-dependent oxidoreductase n=1 Tax=Phytohalomonas tamaricis TaxID=2081032 RepID=UPI000D0B8CB6|nr:NAD(P)-dependent oxidoreductase [Phytohalomonas tamaricis]
MNVALVGASGNAGSRILDELLDRGHRVTAIVRSADKLKSRDNVTIKEGSPNDRKALAQLLRGHDAVITAVKFVETNPNALIGAIKDADVPRYLAVCGTGSLEVKPGKQLMDTEGFPEAYRAEAAHDVVFLDLLRKEKTLEWTCLSPSAEFYAGERTGQFRLDSNHLLIDSNGDSLISFEDYAVALVDELEHPAHLRERFTVGY